MATIKDVARKAGVSVTTVSRALNDYSDVNINTKEHIKRVAKELNYVPNRAAQNLVKKENKTLALILSGLEQEGGKDNIVYRILAGMFKYADEIGYEVVLYTTDSAHQRAKSYVDFCREHNISGAVLNGIRLDDPYLEETIAVNLPVVLVDVDLDDHPIACVTIHNERAAFEAVDLLIKSGHKNIGLLNGRIEADVSLKREAGYRHAMKSHGLTINEDWVTYADYIEATAYEKTKVLIGEHPELTALFCTSDMMAFGAYKAIKELGLRIPEDISIMGFDDVPLAKYANPPLSTVRQDFYLMGYYAARQLIRLIGQEASEKKMYFEHKVVARDSIHVL